MNHPMGALSFLLLRVPCRQVMPQVRGDRAPSHSRLGGRCALPYALLLVIAAGCGGRPARVPVPALDPQAAAAEALRLHDKNGDALLDANELKACPGLQSCAKWVDASADGKLSAEEIAARVRAYVDKRVGRMSFTVTVSRGGKPLEGAEVVLDPEPFLGTALRTARGASRPDGTVVFLVDGSDQPGVEPGMYRVRVSKKDGSGAESLPPRFNSETVLGVEANSAMLSDDEHRATRGFRL